MSNSSIPGKVRFEVVPVLPDPALPLALDCPVCGLATNLRSDQLLSAGALTCPLDHPLPVATIPGLTEILTWLRDLSSAVQPNPG